MTKIYRRKFLSNSLWGAACVTNVNTRLGLAANSSLPLSTGKSALRTRIQGLLLGSMIGDAIGGPVEFQKSQDVAEIMLNCRDWHDDRQLNDQDLKQFVKKLQLHSYEEHRPKTESYGQWRSKAPPGTITDDTRHKMILLNALQQAKEKQRLPTTDRDLATAYLQLASTKPIAKRPEYKELCEQSLREYCKAARWLHGSRDLKNAAPPDRIWGGVPTCSGQMTMLPLAAIYPGRPVEAYRAAYALSFFDVGSAKDLNSAVVAGLAFALRQATPVDQESCRQVWQKIGCVMRSTDPYRYAEIPYVIRPTEQWLDFAHTAASRAQKKPKRLFEILEQEGQVKYFWESHFVLTLVFSVIEFCDYDPLAAMALVLDFGHDTDSAAQLLGAFIGALYGPELFPKHLQQPVVKQLAADYDASVDTWTNLLLSLSDRKKYPTVVAY